MLFRSLNTLKLLLAEQAVLPPAVYVRIKKYFEQKDIVVEGLGRPMTGEERYKILGQSGSIGIFEFSYHFLRYADEKWFSKTI